MAVSPHTTIDGVTYFQANDGRIIRETFRDLPPDRFGRIWQTPVRRTVHGAIAFKARKQLTEAAAIIERPCDPEAE